MKSANGPKEKLMPKRPLTDYSINELEGALAKMRTVQITTAVIFGAIILIWIVGGYVTKNIPVFIATLAMAVTIATLQYASASSMRKELLSRKNRSE
jgi:hypothetical protein